MTADGPAVQLEWVNGKGVYLVGTLVLLTFLKIDLDDKHWDKIQPLFVDGDKANTWLCNLTYRFRELIEAENHPGYYHVPFFSRYAISRKGELINAATGKVKSWYITADNPDKNCLGGYRSTRVVNHHGNSTGVFQHRALCLTFKEYGSNVNELVVNHLDGDKLNSDLPNLEWTTYALNNSHAVETGLRKTALKPILMLNRVSGEVRSFPTMVECLRQLGKSNLSYIYHRLVSEDSSVKTKDSILFKYDDGRGWPETDMQLTNHAANGILATATNVTTGEVIKFSGAGTGQKLTGVKRATILFNLKNDRHKPTGGWVFKKSEHLPA